MRYVPGFGWGHLLSRPAVDGCRCADDWGLLTLFRYDLIVDYSDIGADVFIDVYQYATDGSTCWGGDDRAVSPRSDARRATL